MTETITWVLVAVVIVVLLCAIVINEGEHRRP